MTATEQIEWLDVAIDADVLAGEYYDVWIDARFAGMENEAECYHSHYLEQICRARYARARAL